MSKQVQPQPSSLSTGIVLVGEALGSNEAKHGQYFIGEAGQHLDRCLKAAGLRPRLLVNQLHYNPRKKKPGYVYIENFKNGSTKEIKVEDNGIYITNVIKEQPFKNKIAQFINLEKEQPQVTEEAKEYLYQLIKELKQLKGKIKVLVPTGNVALWALTGILGSWNSRTRSRSSSILNYWGSILECNLPGLEGVKVIPMIHPAAALPSRSPIYTYYIIRALQRIKQEARQAEIVLPIRDLTSETNIESVIYYLEQLKTTAKVVAYDIENIPGTSLITCISLSPSKNISMCIPFTDETKCKIWSKIDENIIWALIQDILEDEGIEKIAHNAAHEFQYLLEVKEIRAANLHDTMIMQRIAYPDFPSSLGFCCAWYTREPYYKEEDDMYLSGNADIETYWRYNAKDSAVLHDVREGVEAELKRIGNWESYLQTVKLLPILGDMQERGVKCDVEGLVQLRKEAEEEWFELFLQLQDEVKGTPLPKKKHRKFYLGGKRLLKSEVGSALLTKQGELSIKALKKEYGDRITVEDFTGFKDENDEWFIEEYLDQAFPNSDAQKKRYYYDFLGYKPYLSRKRNAKDKRRIDEYAMRKLAQKGAPGAGTINKMAKLQKMITDYYDPDKVSKDGRLRASFYIGPKTGRLASSSTTVKKEGRNMQNYNQKMKRLLVADD